MKISTIKNYDIIVVGAGHSGCEASLVSSKMGAKTLLVTSSLYNIAQMSCNPAIGGIAKGQIVREIDALGGGMGIITDSTMIQFKMLNVSKGPAMWSPRAQSDKTLFSIAWRNLLEKTPNLDFYQDTVVSIIVEKSKVVGVKTLLGEEIFSNAVILTNGTFLNGIIHIGEQKFHGGRMGELSSLNLTEQLNDLGIQSGRMKTGTPPRVDLRSLDFSKMIEQPGDENPQNFSFSTKNKLKKQISCWMSHTNENVHNILREGFDKSPMFTGRIQGIGPRYCPSIEDKINKFADKSKHQIFVEPEGWDTIETYVNGFSTSLPKDIQYKAIRQILGFENVKILRPGYAIEYDYFYPTQLKHSLETKQIENLYFAGQINGTTGYEEAGAQGLMAGINAVLKIRQKEDFILGRDEAYIGVLIDDLVTKGTNEPYRMFTSRAEFRTLLRQDNADERLTSKGFNLGIASLDSMRRVEEKISKKKKMIELISKQNISPENINPILESKNSTLISQSYRIDKIISRPNIKIKDFICFDDIKNFIEENDIDDEILEQVEINIKYKGYIDKELENVNKLKKLENIIIPDKFDYFKVKNISIEARQKLINIKPRNISEASKISGVSPSDISVLLVYIGR